MSGPRARYADAGAAGRAMIDAVLDAEETTPADLRVVLAILREITTYSRTTDGLTRKRLAELTNLAPRTLSRSLARLQRIGALRFDRGNQHRQSTIRLPEVDGTPRSPKQVYRTFRGHKLPEVHGTSGESGWDISRRVDGTLPPVDRGGTEKTFRGDSSENARVTDESDNRSTPATNEELDFETVALALRRDGYSEDRVSATLWRLRENARVGKGPRTTWLAWGRGIAKRLTDDEMAKIALDIDIVRGAEERGRRSDAIGRERAECERCDAHGYIEVVIDRKARGSSFTEAGFLECDHIHSVDEQVKSAGLAGLAGRVKVVS